MSPQYPSGNGERPQDVANLHPVLESDSFPLLERYRMSPSLELFASSFVRFLDIYLGLLLIRVLLSWFPIDWSNPPFSILSQLVDPYLNIFRSIIPPLGGMDFSPLLAIFLLRIVAQLFTQLSISL